MVAHGRLNTPKVVSASSFSASDVRRFWLKVDRSGGPGACWSWGAGRSKSGYGQFATYGGSGVRLSWRAHRVAFALANGSAPARLLIRHTCDKPGRPEDKTYRACCNPAHLRSGTHIDNIADRTSRQRSARGSRSGMRIHPDRRPAGERNGSAKLSAASVVSIRRLRAERGLSYGQLGAMFGVTRGTVWKICSGRNWRDSVAV